MQYKKYCIFFFFGKIKNIDKKGEMIMSQLLMEKIAAFQTFKNDISNAGNAFKAFGQQTKDNFSAMHMTNDIGHTLSKANLSESLKNAKTGISSAVKNSTGTIGNAIKSNASNVKSAVGNYAKVGKGIAKNTAGTVGTTIANGAKTTGNVIKNLSTGSKVGLALAAAGTTAAIIGNKIKKKKEKEKTAETFDGMLEKMALYGMTLGGMRNQPDLKTVSKNVVNDIKNPAEGTLARKIRNTPNAKDALSKVKDYAAQEKSASFAPLQPVRKSGYQRYQENSDAIKNIKNTIAPNAKPIFAPEGSKMDKFSKATNKISDALKNVGTIRGNMGHGIS